MGDVDEFYCQLEIEPDSPSWYGSHGIRSLRWLLTLPLQWGSPEIYELCYSAPFLLFIQLENLAQEMVPIIWGGLPIIITPYKGNLLQAFQEMNMTRYSPSILPVAPHLGESRPSEGDKPCKPLWGLEGLWSLLVMPPKECHSVKEFQEILRDNL